MQYYLLSPKILIDMQFLARDDTNGTGAPSRGFAGLVWLSISCVDRKYFTKRVTKAIFPFDKLKQVKMKTRLIVLVALLTSALQGCIVKSIYPFYKESDVTFRKELVGSWVDEENNDWTIHANPFKPNSYELHMTKDNRDVAFSGNLFTIDGQLYLDLFPVSDNKEEMLIFDLHLVPMHSVAMVEKITDSEISIKWFDEEWLYAMFSENRIRIPHEKVMDLDLKPNEDEGMYILTASTEELQKFIVKYRNEAMAYSKNDVSLRWTRTNN